MAVSVLHMSTDAERLKHLQRVFLPHPALYSDCNSNLRYYLSLFSQLRASNLAIYVPLGCCVWADDANSSANHSLPKMSMMPMIEKNL